MGEVTTLVTAPHLVVEIEDLKRDQLESGVSEEELAERVAPRRQRVLSSDYGAAIGPRRKSRVKISRSGMNAIQKYPENKTA